MSDRLIEALRPWVVESAFRADAANFLSLSQDAVDQLVTLMKKYATLDIPMSELTEFKSNYEIDGDIRGVIAAGRLIRKTVRRIQAEERDDCLNSFAERVGSRFFRPEYYAEFFSWLQELDIQDIRDSAIAVAPNLTDVVLTTDLRVVSDPPDVQCGLVPVIFARLEFDETIAGQQALFVQVTRDMVERLEHEVARTRELLKTVDVRFKADIIQKGELSW